MIPGHLHVYDLGNGNLRPLAATPLTSSLGPSDWSPDGQTVLMARVVDDQPNVFSIDVVSGEETRITTSRAAEYSAAYSHAGDRIAFHAEQDGVAHLVITDLQGDARRVVTSGPGLRYNPRWSPGDEWLLFTGSDDGTNYDIRAFRIAGGMEIDLVAAEEDERDPQRLVTADSG